jgi:DNA polymerase-3 subunit epsilon
VSHQFDLDQAIGEICFALFDVETTGLSPAYGHRVCEIACLKVCHGVEEDRFEALVDPGRSISPGAFRVNRITPEMLAGAPAFSTVAQRLLSLMDGAVLVAHNAPFDLGFLAKELEIARMPPPEGPVLDTLTLSRRIYHLASHSLSALAHHFGAPMQPIHRAMSDVETTAFVFDQILWELDRRYGVSTLGDVLDFQGGPIPYPQPKELPLPPSIAEALERHRPVQMRYVDARGAETERMVRPLHVSEQRGYLYLTAHCFWRDGLRTFRLDRIVELAGEEGSHG